MAKRDAGRHLDAAEELELRLAWAGYGRELSAGGGGRASAIEAYKAFHGLPATHDAEFVLKHLRRPRCCRPDRDDDPVSYGAVHRASGMRPAVERGKWGVPAITVSWHFPRIPDAEDTITTAQVGAAWQAVAATWMAHAALTLDVLGPGQSAHIQADSEPIDGPMGTLAWSMLPQGRAGPQDVMRQRYDAREFWGPMGTPASQRGIDFYRVALHEVGHALGLTHSRGAGTDVMNPVMWDFPTDRWLSPTDIRRIQALYGPGPGRLPDDDEDEDDDPGRPGGDDDDRPRRGSFALKGDLDGRRVMLVGQIRELDP